MKSFVVFAFLLATWTTISLAAVENDNDYIEFKCPQPYLNELKPINVNQFLGTWYFALMSPWGDDNDEGPQSECMSETFWRANNARPGELKSVCISKVNGKMEFHETKTTVQNENTANSTWAFTLEGKNGTCRFVDSDNGQSWALGHACFEMEGNSTSVWSFMSRTRMVDPKLAKDILERLVKYSGLTHDKFIGISHTDCYNEYISSNSSTIINLQNE